jgi:hypothetical protein
VKYFCLVGRKEPEGEKLHSHFIISVFCVW